MVQVTRRQVVENTFDEAAVLADLEVFTTLKARIKEMTTLANQHRDRLSAAVESFGEEDEKGHVWLVLPDGRKMQRQCKETSYLDEEVGIPLLKQKAPECVVKVEVVDDDLLMAARFQGRINDEDLSKIYPKTYSYAFIPPR